MCGLDGELAERWAVAVAEPYPGDGLPECEAGDDWCAAGVPLVQCGDSQTGCEAYPFLQRHCYLTGSRGAVVYDDYEQCADSWVLLPGFNLLPNWFLGLVYFLTLIWLFLGVAIVSDVFMASIEVITSKEVTRKYKDKLTGQRYEVRALLWNPTVANLTLLALGSSAPEILLSIIEMLLTLVPEGRCQKPGEIGPNTIVGSAAFNLLMISAVCTLSVPEGELRRISELKVFLITAAFSVMAYVWMLLVLKWWTPDVISIEEALLTLAMFPLMVFLAWGQDVKWKLLSKPPRPDEEGEIELASASELNGAASAEAGALSMPTRLRAGSNGALPHDAAARPRAASITITGPGRSAQASSDPRVHLQHLSYTTKGGARVEVDRAQIANILRKVKQDDAADAAIAESIMQSAAPGATAVPTPPARRLSSSVAAESVLQSIEGPRWSAARYRMNAVRMLAAKPHKKAGPTPSEKHEHAVMLLERSRSAEKTPSGINKWRSFDMDPSAAYVSFGSLSYTVMENAGSMEIIVEREGCTDRAVSVRYATQEDLALAGKDYEHTEGVLCFEVGETKKTININIIDDDVWEPDNHFWVTIEAVEAGTALMPEASSDGGKPAAAASEQTGGGAVEDGDSADSAPSVVVRTPRTKVTIIDDDNPGIFAFKDRRVLVKESESTARCTVLRKLGSDGAVEVSYETVDLTGLEGRDYIKTSGVLRFESGEVEKSIKVPMLRHGDRLVDSTFKVRLHSPTGGAAITRQCECNVVLVDDEEIKAVAQTIAEVIERREESLRVGTSTWAQQFREAIVPSPGVDDDGKEEELTAITLLLHYLAISWKVVFAFIPPSEMRGGWPAFGISLLMIGALTAVIAEFAALFGCACGLKDPVTAITFVALGTSLPDTFASRMATVEAPDADAAIGNVTGSNSVNVFLGLGLPWTIAAIYYKATGGRDYVVPGGSLGFSVTIFTAVAIVAIAVLLVRRRSVGAELGGAGKKQVAMLFGFLWLLYVTLSSLQEYGHIPGF